MVFGWLFNAAKTAVAAVKNAAKTVWKAAKDAARTARDAAMSFLASATARIKKHPILGGIAAGGLLTFVIPGIAVAVIIGGLNLIGFGTAGVVPATTAAAIQSSIGNVAASSLFATLTSAAAGGYGVLSITTVVQAVGATLAVVAAGIASAIG